MIKESSVTIFGLAKAYLVPAYDDTLSSAVSWALARPLVVYASFGIETYVGNAVRDAWEAEIDQG